MAVVGDPGQLCEEEFVGTGEDGVLAPAADIVQRREDQVTPLLGFGDAVPRHLPPGVQVAAGEVVVVTNVEVVDPLREHVPQVGEKRFVVRDEERLAEVTATPIGEVKRP